MTDPSKGVLLSLGTWVFWSLSPFFFTATIKRIGSSPTNVIRLTMAVLLLVLVFGIRALFLHRLPPMPGAAAWLWLTVSGILGLVVGDLLLYRSYATLGPERTSQI